MSQYHSKINPMFHIFTVIFFFFVIIYVAQLVSHWLPGTLKWTKQETKYMYLEIYQFMKSLNLEDPFTHINILAEDILRQNNFLGSGFCLYLIDHFQLMSFTRKVRQLCTSLWCHLPDRGARLYPCIIKVHQASSW